ncbi:MAG: hypothetical protein AAB850_00415 [Patescibacteria group bacterium]
MANDDYQNIPFIARKIFDEIWKQNKDVFETMDKKEMAEEIFSILIEELMDELEFGEDL